jgi:hypothetical protein
MPVELRPVGSVCPCNKYPRSILSELTPSPRDAIPTPRRRAVRREQKSERADRLAKLLGRVDNTWASLGIWVTGAAP